MAKHSKRIQYSLNRREVLIQGVAGALAVAGFGSRTGIVFAGTPGVANGETPGLTEGPYWVDGQPERVDVRTDSLTGIQQAGMPLYLGLTISQLPDTAPYTIAPLAGAKVDIWSCNAQGVYSDEAVEGTTGSNYLRGYQISNAHGVVEFLTIYPGWYSGRTPHIHVRVRTYDATGTQTYNFTSQFFFDENITNTLYASNAAYARPTQRDTTNATDNIFYGASANGSPESEAGDYMLLKLADDGTHVVGSFHIVLDLSDSANADPTNGSETGGGFGGGGPGGSGGPPPGSGGPPPGSGGPPPGSGGPGFGGGTAALDPRTRRGGRSVSAGALTIADRGPGGAGRIA
jgi:protocatechuate 3,4-dioxygenase beta subunit